MIRLLLVLAALLTLPGCQAPQVARTATYNPAEYEAYLKGGTGIIEGQAFLVTRGGDVKLGAARTVFANPVTSYSTEWYNQMVVGMKRLSDPDPQVPMPKQALCDAEGRFRIEGLAAGDYYLSCFITWETGQGITGGNAHARVTVREGQVTKAILTR